MDEYTYQIDIALTEKAGTEDEYLKPITIMVTVKSDGLYYADIGYGEQVYSSHQDILRHLSQFE